MRAGLVVAAAVLAASGAAAEAMPLPVFLDKAEALQRKGMLALFSSDLSVLKNEVRAATERCAPSAWRRSAPASRRLIARRRRVER